MKQADWLIYFISIICLICPKITESQEQDLGLWTSINLKKNITKEFNLGLEQGLRYNQNISRFKSTYSELELQYKLNKYIKLSGNYRYMYKQLINFTHLNSHRFQAGLTLRYKIKRIKLVCRNKYEIEYNGYSSEEDGKIPDKYYRNRFGIEYNIKKCKLSPFITFEMFYNIGYKIHQIDKYRYKTGFEYKINSKKSFDLFYHIQNKVNVPNPEKIYIFGINYTYTL